MRYVYAQILADTARDIPFLLNGNDRAVSSRTDVENEHTAKRDIVNKNVQELLRRLRVIYIKSWRIVRCKVMDLLSVAMSLVFSLCFFLFPFAPFRYFSHDLLVSSLVPRSCVFSLVPFSFSLSLVFSLSLSVTQSSSLCFSYCLYISL